MPSREEIGAWLHNAPEGTDEEAWMDEVPPMSKRLQGKIALTGGSMVERHGTKVQLAMPGLPEQGGGHEYMKQAGDEFEIPGEGIFRVSDVAKSGNRIVLIGPDGNEFVVGRQAQVARPKPVPVPDPYGGVGREAYLRHIYGATDSATVEQLEEVHRLNTQSRAEQISRNLEERQIKNQERMDRIMAMESGYKVD